MPQIYILENKINNKCYVGQTTRTFTIRLKSHLRNKKQIINRALRKYGIKNFSIFVFVVPEELLDYFEKEMIKRLDAMHPKGYNLDSGGNKNKYYSKESREKMSKAKKGVKLSDEHKKKISDANKNPSAETREKISNSLKGKCRSEKTKRKISKSNKGKNHPNYGKHLSEKHKKNLSKSVINLDTGQIFESMKEASIITKTNYTSICLCCRGQYKRAGKYHWAYYE